MLFFEGTPVEAWVLARVLAPVLVFAEPRSVWKPDERAVAAPLFTSCPKSAAILSSSLLFILCENEYECICNCESGCPGSRASLTKRSAGTWLRRSAAKCTRIARTKARE